MSSPDIDADKKTAEDDNLDAFRQFEVKINQDQTKNQSASALPAEGDQDVRCHISVAQHSTQQDTSPQCC